MDKIVTFGEIMLRLKPPGHERLLQQPRLEATFGGGEANVAVSVSLLGKQGVFVTAVPANPIGEAVITEMRRYGVETSRIQKRPGRLGVYYVENGAMQRPSTVVYDRDYSCISLVKPGDFDWKAIFAGDECCGGKARWFHVTGITPAVSAGAAEAAIEAAQTAQAAGVTVSIDLNYRKKLWNYGKKPPEVMRELTKHADVIIANEEDIQKCLGIEAKVDVTSGKLNTEVYRDLTAQVKKEFSTVSVVAVTLRESKSADQNGWSGALSGKTGFYLSQRYDLDDIVDRVGGGDSFSAGLIFGLLEFPRDEQYALNFAVAASALKHSIPGDFNLTTRDQVEALCKGDGSGRVQR
ncbi:MAG: sugar kinase [Spirochaetaceae bacterium]|jgi:2-dehydro-3-deoxygluconokinase|nr:sugar kinase [Spirochaetaceae bacterium]